VCRDTVSRQSRLSYWRAHTQEKKQQMNTLLTVALAHFVGNQIGKD
jgi:hypothetical protein